MWLVVALALVGRVCAALLTLLTRNNVVLIVSDVGDEPGTWACRHYAGCRH